MAHRGSQACGARAAALMISALMGARSEAAAAATSAVVEFPVTTNAVVVVEIAGAATRLPWKHARQRTGRPCVGLKGTVVSTPHSEQVVRVSVREIPAAAGPAPARAAAPARLDLQGLQRLGSFLNCLSKKKSCSPAVKMNSPPQSAHVKSRSTNSIAASPVAGQAEAQGGFRGKGPAERSTYRGLHFSDLQGARGRSESGVLHDNRRRAEVDWIRRLASEQRESVAGVFFAAISFYVSRDGRA